MADTDETTAEVPALTVTIPLPDLARMIRAQLAFKGKTATWLAGYLGISPSSVAHRLSGRIAWTQEELEAVAAALDIPRADISPILAMLPMRRRRPIVGGRLADVLDVLNAAAPGTTLGQLDEQLGGAR